MSDKLGSIVNGFFYGEVEESSLFPYPNFSDEQKEFGQEMAQAVSRYAQESIDSAKMDEESNIPDEIMQGLAELGLFGLGVPEEHGGMGLDYSLYARVFSEISEYDASVATMLGAHQSIGYRALLNEGSDEQKGKWLPGLASGETLAAFCLTEPGSGSDAYSIKTKAVKNQDGTYTINGQKLWITNGGSAKFYTVFCKTEHKDGDKVTEKISAFIVEGGSEGLSFGEKENKMGIRASETRAVFFDNVIVPAENILGGLGQGFKVAMKVLNSGRLSLGSGAVGGMKRIIALATEHAKGRKQFGDSISNYGLIQEKLALMAASCYATESIVYLTTGNIIKGMDDYQLESAICKIYGSESLWSVVDTSLQIAAGNGYMREYPYEQLMRDCRINLIFEGTNEILRIFVSLSGLRGPGEAMRELGKVSSDMNAALKDPIKSVGILTDFAKGRISKMINSTSLSLVHNKLEEEADLFTSMLGSFAIQVENTLIKYGKKIIGNELPQGRLANMVIELYVQAAVLSRTTSILNNSDVPQDKKDYVLDLTRLIFRESHHKFTAAHKGMSRNNDKVIKKTSEAICNQGGYGLDILNY